MESIIVDQKPAELSPDALANTEIKICHRLDGEEDKKAVASSMNLDKDSVEHIGLMDVGEAFIKVNKPGFKGSFLARIEPIELERRQIFTGEVSQEEISRYMREFYRRRGMKPIKRSFIDVVESRRWFHSVKKKLEECNMLGIEVIRLLALGKASKSSDLKEKLNVDGTTVRLSTTKLAKLGLIGFKRVRTKGNPVIYFLRPEGEVAFYIIEGLTADEARGKSIKEKDHSTVKRRVAEIFTNIGYKPANKRVKNGYVDLCFRKGGEEILVEIETGSNSYEQVYKNLEKCVKQIGKAYFMAVTQEAYNVVLQQSARLRFDNPKISFELNLVLYENFTEGGKFEKYIF